MKLFIVRTENRTYAINPLEILFISMVSTYVEVKLTSGIELKPKYNCNDLTFWINEWQMAINSKDR